MSHSVGTDEALLRFELMRAIGNGVFIGAEEFVNLVANAATQSPEPGFARLAKTKAPKFRRAMANARAGVGATNSSILCIGDSTTRGRNSGITANLQYKAAYPHVMAGALTSKLGVKFGRDCWMGEGNMDPQDERLSVTGFIASGGGLGGFCYFTTSAATLAFTPAGAWDAAEIFYVKTSTSDFDVTIGGSPPDSGADASEATGANSYIVTSGEAAAVQALSIAWVAGTLRIMGIRCYNTAVPEITVFNCGVSGGTAAQTTGLNASTGPETWMGYLAPALSILDYGINEYRNGVTLAAYKASMVTVIERLMLSGDVIIKTPMPDSSAPPIGIAQSAYVDIARDLAAVYDLPLIDTFEIWGSYAAGDALGYYVDTVHGTARGYANVAALASFALTTLD